MSTNAELARVFDEMASVLQLAGANSFRASSHARVARVLRDLAEDVASLADDPKKLTAIEGIGDGSARRIAEYVSTGRIAEHNKLFEKVPRGLLEVMKIPGLGPKTVQMLWKQAGVTDLETLAAALESGELEELPRLGAKSVENIRKAISFAKRSGDRTRIGTALPIAERIVAMLEPLDGVEQVAYAGSLRRGCETIGDIDILAAATDPDVVAETFRTMDDVTQVLVAGSTKSSVRLAKGIQVDLRIVDASSFGAALLYFTGSKDHNIVMRERAIKRGMRLNEYGLFPGDADEEAPPQDRGVEPVASRHEEEIFAALELPWVPPELREDAGEFAAEMPDLLEFADIRAELHAHTTASDGHLSIDELAAEAKARGFHTIAVTDHSQSSVLANGLDPDRLRRHIDAVRAADERTKGIRILAGSEVDILVDGTLDYDDELLAALDIVVASPHVSLGQEPATATARLLAAIRHPLVHIIGHPTGRIVNRREGLQPDMAALIEAAVEHDTALEINANDHRLDLRDAHVRAAVRAGAKIAINTDAHGEGDFDHLRYGVLTGRRGWLTKEQCLNAWTPAKLKRWLESKR